MAYPKMARTDPHPIDAPYRALALLACALLTMPALAGCGSSSAAGGGSSQTVGETDAGSEADAGTDAGAAEGDAGSSQADAGTSAADTGGSTGADAGPRGKDAGSAGADTAAGGADAGSSQLDAGSTPGDAGGSSGVDGPLPAHWGPKSCAKSGPAVGFKVGQRLGNIVVHDCDTGAARSLDEVCGSKATWLFVAHSHCPTCQQTAKYTAGVAKAMADKDVAIVHVLYIDDGQTCAQWRKQYNLEGLPNVRFYVDKTGKSWAQIKTKNYTAPHAIMTKDRVITYKNHGLSSAGVKTLINQALAKAK